MSRQEDALATLERLRITFTPNSKNRGTGGRTDPPSTLSTALSELIGVLCSWSESIDIVLAGLRILDVAFGNTQAATVVRLEGGLKVLVKLLRSYSADAAILGACARAISSCVASSHVNQEVLAKEKGLPTLLLSCLAARSREPDVAKPLLEVVVGLSRTQRGAAALAAGDNMMLLTKELLITLMGNWETWGLVLKALKLQSKQEGCAALLMSVNQGEVSRVLQAVSRLLIRIPGQYKLLKRVSRTLWLLNDELLPTLPTLEPPVPLPSRDAPHLAGLSSALECTETHQHRLMELVPEEYAAELQQQYERQALQQQQREQEGDAGQQQAADHVQGTGLVATVDGFELLPAARSPHPARVWRHRHHLPPSARQCAAQAPGPPEPFHDYEATQTAVHMMMHDLRRLVIPGDNTGRVVYDSSCQDHEVISLGSALQGLQCSSDSAAHLPRGNASSSSKQQQELKASEQRTAMVYAERLRCTATTNGTSLQAPPSPLPHVTKLKESQRLPPLSFQSNFESGNLRMAVQVYDNEYDLFLAPDLNDRSDNGNLCQWFYFSLTGVQPGVPYKFNIVNLRKKQSLFSNGKQPLVCRAAQRSSSGANSHIGGIDKSSNGSVQQDGQLAAALVPDVEGCWVRAGGYVSYYPSPYRGRQPAGAGTSSTTTGATTKRASTTGKKAGIKTSKVSRAGSSAMSESTASSHSNCSSSSGRKKEQAAKDVSGGSSSSSNVGPGLYAASFMLVFPQPGTYYLASCYPYTYTDLQEHLDSTCTRLAAQPFVLPATTASPTEQPGACTSDLQPINYIQPAAAAVSSCLPAGLGPSLLGGMMVRAVLGYSLAGHAVELLTITDFTAPPDAVAARECVVITARVHPGETCASWIMQGMIDFLTSDDPSAQLLRSSFVFKLVPMMNADGVVNGSYRCSLSGCDLNRVWEKPSRSAHPCIYHAKHLLQALASGGEGRLALFIDIHGHSCKEDVFFYGCEPALSNLLSLSPSGVIRPSAGVEPDPMSSSSGQMASSRPGSGPAATKMSSSAASTAQPVGAKVAARLRVRMLPYLMSKTGSHWSMSKSSWRIRKSKLGAARVVSHRRLGCAGAYTLEASLAGCSTTRTHFSLHDYMSMGAELGRAIAQLAEVDDEALLQEMAAALTLPPYSAAYTA